MNGRDAMPVPQLSDLDAGDAKAVARFEAQITLLRRLGIKEFVDHAGRKIVLFETGSRGFPSPLEREE